MFSVKLPFPPTVNTYYRMVKMGNFNRMLISERGRDYAQAVAIIIRPMIAGGPYPLLQELSVTIHVTPPDRRIRDLDNLNKAIFDSLTKAGVWKDDSQLSRIVMQRLPVDPHNGSIHIQIEAA